MEQAILTSWYIKYRKPMIRFLQSRSSRMALPCEDIVQQTFYRVHQQVKVAADVESPESYLFKSALNVLAEWLDRAAQKRPHYGSEEAGLDEHECSIHIDPAEIHARHSAERDLHRKIQDLTPQQRKCVNLQLDGLSYKEISAATGLTDRATLRALSGAFSKLRVEYGVKEMTQGQKERKRAKELREAKKQGITLAPLPIGKKPKEPEPKLPPTKPRGRGFKHPPDYLKEITKREVLEIGAKTKIIYTLSCEHEEIRPLKEKVGYTMVCTVCKEAWKSRRMQMASAIMEANKDIANIIRHNEEGTAWAA